MCNTPLLTYENPREYENSNNNFVCHWRENDERNREENEGSKSWSITFWLERAFEAPNEIKVILMKEEIYALMPINIKFERNKEIHYNQLRNNMKYLQLINSKVERSAEILKTKAELEGGRVNYI